MADILLTNDDGAMSPGLWALHKALRNLGKIVVVAPDGPRSATSMSLTFHKPLRITKISVNAREAFAVSGNPADCVSLGVSQILRGQKPKVVVSGTNPGDNTTAQSVFASGTVAAAMQAAILGIPAIAFSVVAHEDHVLTSEDYETRLKLGFELAQRLVSHILKERLPKGIDFLNVNFPERIGRSTPIRITRLGRLRFENFVVEREDPRKTPYYWQTGNWLEEERYEPGTDAFALLVEHAVSITPMTLDVSANADAESLRALLGDLEKPRT